MPPRVVIMGPQGAGKGTQSRRLAEAFDVDHVATGDILRANKDLETEHGTPREYMKAGELVPDEVMAAVVDEALAGRDGYVLDGYPRTLPQAEYLLEVADPDLVLVVDVSDAVAVERLTGRRVCDDCGANYHVDFDPPAEPGICDECGGDLIRRDDDTPEAIRTRLEEYHRETEPVVEFFEEETDLPVRHVDGEQSPDDVWADVKMAVRAEA
ncbi:MAG: adenylate kinase [Halobacteriaceae archaeon]